jgi:uncharacterized protein (TIGR02466 family)
MSIQLLFPTPIVVLDIPQIPYNDHNFLLNAEYITSPHNFNRSKNTYILKDRDTELTRWIQVQLDIFALEVLATKSKLKITQSWCLKHTNQKQQVHSHAHPNSIVSGAYYVEAPANSQSIKFSNQQSNYVKWSTDKDILPRTPWAWDWHEIPVTTGRLILFPSHMNHSVEGEIINKDTRCVLSFNTWFDGTFGEPESLFELKL